MTERQQEIISKITNQAESGFSKKEISNNLINEGYSEEEVEPFLTKVSTLTSTQRQTLTTVLLGISVFFGVKAYEQIQFNKFTPLFWGYCGIGLLVFILFIGSLKKKKPF